MARDSRICDNDIRKILIFFSRIILRFGAATLRVVYLSFVEQGIVCPLLFFLVCTVQSQYIGHLHDGVILPLRPESFSFFLSYLNFVIPVRFE